MGKKDNIINLIIKDAFGKTGGDWKDSFQHICEYQGKSMTDVLNDFVRSYVDENKPEQSE